MVGWAIHPEESEEHARALFERLRLRRDAKRTCLLLFILAATSGRLGCSKVCSDQVLLVILCYTDEGRS